MISFHSVRTEKREAKEIVPISIAGNLTDKRKGSGFTLVELAAVIFILSSFFMIAFPELKGIFPERELASSARRLAGEINFLYCQAVMAAKESALLIDMEKGMYWSIRKTLEGEEEKLHSGKLLKSVAFEDVMIAGKEVVEEKAQIKFLPHGVVEDCTIHLINSEGKRVSLIVEGFTGKVKLHEGYIK